MCVTPRAYREVVRISPGDKLLAYVSTSLFIPAVGAGVPTGPVDAPVVLIVKYFAYREDTADEEIGGNIIRRVAITSVNRIELAPGVVDV